MEILGEHGQPDHVLLVDGFLPLKESLRKVLLVKVDQSQLYSVHIMPVESDIFSPDAQAAVHHILVSLHEVSEKLRLVFLTRHLDQLFSLSLKLLSDWDLVFELLSCCLEFIIDIGVSNAVKAFFQEHLSSCPFDFLNKKLLLKEILILTRILAPLLPGFELDDLVI